MKTYFMFAYLIGLLSFFAFNSCNHKAEPETYLIPEGFTGKVNIIFNRKEGSPIKYESGRRIYDIPADGILITQFSTNDGFIDRKYFYKKHSGELKPLKTFEADTTAAEGFNRDEVGVFLDGTSGVYGNSGEPNALEYQEFIVSSYNNLDSFFTSEYKRNFDEKIEKISNLKLN